MIGRPAAIIAVMDDKTLRLLEFDKIRLRLAEHAAFAGGRRRAMALRPAVELEEVRARQSLTAEARDFIARRGRPEMGHAHELQPEIEGALRGRLLLPAELLEVRDTVAVGRRLAHAAGREQGRWPGLSALAGQLEPCPALFDAIQGALDDDGELRDEASPALKRIRREKRVAQDRIRRQLEGMLGDAGLRDRLQEALITQRNGRYVLPVKSEFRSRLRGVVHDTSDSGATVFIEPLSTVESGNRLRELEVEEEKEIDRILRELSGFVAAEAEALGETIEALGELDLGFACADYGYALRGISPRLVEADVPRLDWPRARHPLIEAEQVVAVDVRVGGDFRQLVITGPNTGGKTVTLKTTGLLVLMAQAGLQIPCGEEAELAVFDAVFADIGDEQSIEQSLSTFSGHMTNIIAILEKADAKSLVLLDELGAGTDPGEGAALAGALLEHLRERGIATVASTHYSELKAYAHGTEGVANASVEFDLQTLRPTYELTIGLPGQSNALAIAGRLGLPEAIIESARQGLAVSDLAMEDLLAEIREARRQSAEDREAASRARQKAEEWAAKLERGLHDVEAQREQILARSRQQAQDELEAARAAVARLLERAERLAERAETMDQVQALAGLRQSAEELERVEEIVRESAPPAPARRSGSLPEDLAPGDRVRVRSLGQEGEVLRRDEDSAEVQMGALRMAVDLDDLELIPRAKPEPEAGPEPKLRRADEASDSMAVELDLRGLRVEEGLDRLEGYLDDALLLGLPWVRVIHGHGTGAMKSAVREALRRMPFVERSRPGEAGEGGDGATVVYLD